MSKPLHKKSDRKFSQELDKKIIEREAKKILDTFAKTLEKVEKEKGSEEYFVHRDEFEREEKQGDSCTGFKELFLANAPHHDKDFVIAEKGEWKC